MRDWKSAATLEPPPGGDPEADSLTYWARTIAAGHLHRPDSAHASLAHSSALMDELNKTRPDIANSTAVKVSRDEMLAWTAFAENKQEEALKQMRQAADLQDKVGQGEVDIPAREMLADILLEVHQSAQALLEYDTALKLSPNRFNGLFHAGMAAETLGDKTRAAKYYAALLKSTNNGSQSTRSELAHVKDFVAATQLAAVP
jgi:tetratricopeptide (TPR) repeat protein